MQEQTPYQLIGGAERVRELVDRFYDCMDSLPEARKIRDVAPMLACLDQDIPEARLKTHAA